MEQRLFADLLGQQFVLQAPKGGISARMELVEARTLGAAALPGGRAPFSLLFRAGGGPLLPQQIYRVSHPALPPMDIFLGPVAADGEGPCYEAVFN